MSNDIVDIEVHVDELLSEEKKTELIESVRHLDGVVSIGFSDTKPHMAFVEYNPDAVNSKAILDRVKDCGVHAELIGL